MRDFEPNLLFNLGGHVLNLPEIKIIDNSASRRDQRWLYRTLSAASREFLPQKFPYLDPSGPAAVAGRIATKRERQRVESDSRNVVSSSSDSTMNLRPSPRYA